MSDFFTRLAMDVVTAATPTQPGVAPQVPPQFAPGYDVAPGDIVPEEPPLPTTDSPHAPQPPTIPEAPPESATPFAPLVAPEHVDDTAVPPLQTILAPDPPNSETETQHAAEAPTSAPSALAHMQPSSSDPPHANQVPAALSPRTDQAPDVRSEQASNASKPVTNDTATTPTSLPEKLENDGRIDALPGENVTLEVRFSLAEDSPHAPQPPTVSEAPPESATPFTPLVAPEHVDDTAVPPLQTILAPDPPKPETEMQPAAEAPTSAPSALAHMQPSSDPPHANQAPAALSPRTDQAPDVRSEQASNASKPVTNDTATTPTSLPEKLENDGRIDALPGENVTLEVRFSLAEDSPHAPQPPTVSEAPPESATPFTPLVAPEHVDDTAVPPLQTILAPDPLKPETEMQPAAEAPTSAPSAPAHTQPPSDPPHVDQAPDVRSKQASATPKPVTNVAATTPMPVPNKLESDGGDDALPGEKVTPQARFLPAADSRHAPLSSVAPETPSEPAAAFSPLGKPDRVGNTAVAPLQTTPAPDPPQRMANQTQRLAAQLSNDTTAATPPESRSQPTVLTPVNPPHAEQAPTVQPEQAPTAAQPLTTNTLTSPAPLPAQLGNDGQNDGSPDNTTSDKAPLPKPNNPTAETRPASASKPAAQPPTPLPRAKPSTLSPDTAVASPAPHHTIQPPAEAETKVPSKAVPSPSSILDPNQTDAVAADINPDFAAPVLEPTQSRPAAQPRPAKPIPATRSGAQRELGKTLPQPAAETAAAQQDTRSRTSDIGSDTAAQSTPPHALPEVATAVLPPPQLSPPNQTKTSAAQLPDSDSRPSPKPEIATQKIIPAPTATANVAHRETSSPGRPTIKKTTVAREAVAPANLSPTPKTNEQPQPAAGQKTDKRFDGTTKPATQPTPQPQLVPLAPNSPTVSNAEQPQTAAITVPQRPPAAKAQTAVQPAAEKTASVPPQNTERATAVSPPAPVAQIEAVPRQTDSRPQPMADTTDTTPPTAIKPAPPDQPASSIQPANTSGPGADQPANPSTALEAPPIVTVTIGRVVVKAAPPPTPPSRPAQLAGRRQPAVSLQDYLARHGRKR